jgi:hypothetical protein
MRADTMPHRASRAAAAPALAAAAGRCYISRPSGDEPNAPAGKQLSGALFIVRDT